MQLGACCYRTNSKPCLNGCRTVSEEVVIQASGQTGVGPPDTGIGASIVGNIAGQAPFFCQFVFDTQGVFRAPGGFAAGYAQAGKYQGIAHDFANFQTNPSVVVGCAFIVEVREGFYTDQIRVKNVVVSGNQAGTKFRFIFFCFVRCARYKYVNKMNGDLLAQIRGLLATGRTRDNQDFVRYGTFTAIAP